MQAHRTFGQVKDRRVLIELPSDFDGRKVEIIVLTLDEPSPSPVRRRIQPDSADPTKIHGDIVRRVDRVSTGDES
jgi:hypothetical protein